MCGIAGFLLPGGGDADSMRDAAERMAASLRHRGPDDEGSWVDAWSGLAFAFRRLRIIDLTEAGAQPMRSASGRYAIVFNGEIYNFEHLRAELVTAAAAPPFRGHSDTEVMLACIEAWGVREAVRRFIGMFAFALWDRQEKTLTLARDRAGVKPLFVAASPRRILFASELGAIAAHPSFRMSIDRGAAALYARWGYVPAPHSIAQGVRKLPPGTLMTVRADGTSHEETYWDAARIAESTPRFEGSEDDALNRLEPLLADAVALRMIADVPVGVFLSGGIDSALVTALAQRATGSRVRTFTIGFDDPRFDESRAAAAIASHLGTDHTELRVGRGELLDAVPLMPGVVDEPLSDTSIVPTYLVARLARPHVTVALSGDGGDELFGGYHRYFLGRQMTERVARVPRRLRRAAGVALAPWSRISGRARRYAQALRARDAIAYHLAGLAEEQLRIAAEAPPFVLTSRNGWPRLGDTTELQMFLDFASYLPDDILAKVDRATMAVSLESREPLLDHGVIELAWSLPLSMKVSGGSGKRILRSLLRRHVPDALIGAEKRGFGLPIAEWLRTALRDWVEANLPRDDDTFDAAAVRALWREHLAGRDRDALLWRVAMFEAWRREHVR